MMGRGYESVGPKGADLGELYRRRMAQMLMQQGMSDAPLGSGNPLEGIARALTAGVGGHLAKRADEREGERNSAIAAELSRAFQPQTAPDPTVAGPRVGTGTTTQPDPSSIVKALMGSQYPELQEFGQGAFLRDMDRRSNNEDWQNRFQMQDSATAARAREAERAADERLKLQLDSASQDRAASREQARSLADMQRQTALEVANIRAAAGKQATAPTDPAKIGSGWAGGTATDNLYNPNDTIDRTQARVDSQEGAKVQTDARKAAEQATGLLGDVRNMQSADKVAYTGPLAGINQFGNQVLGFLGNEDAQRRATAYETIEGGAADMARGERTPGEGAVSDFDAKQFLVIVPGPKKTEQFNQRALELREQAALMAQERPIFMNEYRRRNGNLVGAAEAWQRYANANPIVNPNIDINKPDTFLNPKRQPWQTFFGEGGGQEQLVSQTNTGKRLRFNPETGDFE